MADAGFDYDEAFDRNIGWVTQDEQRSPPHRPGAIATGPIGFGICYTCSGRRA